MSKFYGSITNRLEEGQNFTGREIRAGDDITMYLWSDRRCYYVTEVIDQKRIKVRPYYVCADHSKPGGMGHQDWVFFKSTEEYCKYIGNTSRNLKDPKEETWVFRYNKWMQEITYGKPEKFCNEYGLFFEMTDKEKKSLEKNGYFKRYFNLTGKVSFGVRDYYYDWEF